MVAALENPILVCRHLSETWTNYFYTGVGHCIHLIHQINVLESRDEEGGTNTDIVNRNILMRYIYILLLYIVYDVNNFYHVCKRRIN